ncbi:TadG family pilus assembly protein [Hyphococcus sp. DH-69]|uniref:TadG family pilus assembly protein n=1 Tax=Hyphococcus formosus TaxID=3143534 RepID=UPI00398ACB9F
MKISGKTLRAFYRAKNGSVYFIFAAVLPLCFFCLGFGVDLMMLFTEKRRAQGVVDIAAIIAAQDPSNPERAAREILSINGYDTVSDVELGQMEEEEREEAVATKSRVQVEPGRYVPDPEKSYKARFVAGQTPYNAARVTVRKNGKYFFVNRFDATPEIAVRATASRRALAAFSVGSRLASINEGMLNQLLGEMIGVNFSLTALDYKNMQVADVEVFSFINALAIQLDVVSGTYGDVLGKNPTLGDIIEAMIAVNGDGEAAMALRKIQSIVSRSTKSIDLRAVIDLGDAGEISLGEPVGAGFPAHVSLFDFVMANAIAAKGDGILELDLSSSVAGLASLDAILDLGEPMQSSPWLSVGQGGQVVSNVQARLFIEATIGGKGLLSSATIRFPLYLEAARASGELVGVDCPGGRIENVTVRLQGASSVVDAWIGEATIANSAMRRNPSAAIIVKAPALKVYGKSHAGTEAGHASYIDFDWYDIVDGRIKTTSTNNIPGRLLANLVDDIELEVNALGLGLNTRALTRTAIPNSLEEIATPLGTVVDQMLAALGIGLGEGDFRVNGAKCDYAVLVE